MTIMTVKAKFNNGTLTPLEPLDLPEGALVELYIWDRDAPDDENAEAEDAGLLRAMLEVSIDDPSEFVSKEEVMATLRSLRDSDGD